MNGQPSCEERISAELESTIRDLRALWDLYCQDSEAYHDDLGHFHEYGLCFDYVPPETFTDQLEGYWRYQISTGGPGDEFRFYSSHPDATPYRIEYVFLDWFDGATRRLYDDDKDLLLEVWEFFSEIGSVRSSYEDALDY